MNFKVLRILFCALFLAGFVSISFAEDIFLEAENFKVSGSGWKPAEGNMARSASRLKVLQGSTGQFDSVAYETITIPHQGKYRIWVRYSLVPTVRGTFKVSVISNNQEIASKEFDTSSDRERARDRRLGMDYVWDFLEADLPSGKIMLTITKTGAKSVSPLSRCIDCIFITDNLKLKEPDYTAYGPGIYLRVSVGDGYEKPFYIHIFSDYFRSPWYRHYSLTPDGLNSGIRPAAGRKYFEDNVKTNWINIAKLMYFDSGVNLLLSPRYTYTDVAPRFKVKFEFATEPDDSKIIKIIERDAQPSGIHIIIPPDYAEPEGAKKLTDDLEIALNTGKFADSFNWPTIGKKPEIFPFFSNAQIENDFAPLDKKLTEREWKTLDYFGFCNREKTRTGGLWLMKNDCYCQPDIEKMKQRAKSNVENFKKKGESVDKIVYAMLMDEPVGQPLSHIANCPVCTEKFRDWLKQMKKTPSDLLVKDWSEVKPVDNTQADIYPALYYYSQRFRSRALADFMIIQKNLLKDAWEKDIPASPNFSDGATYVANFYFQGVDYFEILEPGGMNALWGENWGNGSLTREATTYNVELMRSAAMKNNQVLGHYLIVYAGRLPWDIKTIAVSQVARDVKVFTSFHYGPSWAKHEGGPPWNSSSLYSHPEKWYSQAELVREIGWAEDMLVPAKKVPSQVAILYSSSSDIWDLQKNYAFGFERMFTWLALTHNQVPVDFVSEQTLAEKGLSGYKVCYFSGRNLTRQSAEKLKQWVRNGGTLFLTAGAGSRDEYNRPMDILYEIIPVKTEDVQQLQVYLSSGKNLDRLTPKDTVSLKDGTKIDVLSVKQNISPKPGSQILGSFSDTGSAIAMWKTGRGTVYYSGFLPALTYAYNGLVERNKVAPNINLQEVKLPDPDKIATETQLLARSYNPWKYPEQIRNLLVLPVKNAGVEMSISCSIPLVDAVMMECDKGILIPLANYTLQPIKNVELTVKTKKPVKSIESTHIGKIPFNQQRGYIKFSLPLKETDFIKLLY